MRKVSAFVALACLFTACKPSVNITKAPTAGNADFTMYMAIGNSLTSGYADNSLYLTGQLNSYPQRLFEQFSLVGAKGPFVQPLLPGDGGWPKKKLQLMDVTHCDGSVSLGPDTSAAALDSSGSYRFNNTYANNQLNNIGVPLIRVVDFPVAGYAALNPYANRFFKNPAGTPIDELKYRVDNLHPSFFTMWLGANDVLGFATAGGVGNGTGNAAPVVGNIYGPSNISPTSVFQTLYDSILNITIGSSSPNGALINVPDVTSIPYFTTVPINGLTITRQSLADSLQAVYATKNFDKVFTVGANYFIVETQDETVRQAVPGELLLLTVPLDSLTCAGWGSFKPIPSKYVLTTEEIQQIRAATTAFNSFIQQEADRHHLAYVDMNQYLKTVASGIAYNGVNYSTQYVTGGAFSLDGVHLTQRGYAIVANKIIETINAFYHSTIPYTDVNRYSGVSFP